MEFVIPAPPPVNLEVTGEAGRFPVRRIYCVGRNYVEHVREMGNDDREPPFFFQKPADAILPSGSDFPYPPRTSDVHHEIELVVAIGRGGHDIAEGDAFGHVYGYAVGIDFTRRDLQGKAKEMHRPWEAGKAFDHAAPCSAVRPAGAIGHPDSGGIWLSVNGEVRQDGDLAQQIWTVPETIEQLSGLFALVPGDLIFTGTPAGVGAVVSGDRLSGGIDGIGEIEISIV